MHIIMFFLISMNGANLTVHDEKPDNVVLKMYAQIVERQPLGIPTGADKTAIWPFLSERLVRVLETAAACEDDYWKKNADSDGKPNFGWLEYGLFSGANEKALPTEVMVKRTEQQKNGLYLVYLRFTYKETFRTYGRPPNTDSSFQWYGAAVVKSEDGRFVVDDILLYKGTSNTIESRLSDLFRGCDGPHWVGQ